MYAITDDSKAIYKKLYIWYIRRENDQQKG